MHQNRGTEIALKTKGKKAFEWAFLTSLTNTDGALLCSRRSARWHSRQKENLRLEDSIFEKYFRKKSSRFRYVYPNSCKKQFIRFSVSRSFQKYSENFSELKNLQDFCKILNQDKKFASNVLSKTIVPWFISLRGLTSSKILAKFWISFQDSCKF